MFTDILVVITIVAGRARGSSSFSSTSRGRRDASFQRCFVVRDIVSFSVPEKAVAWATPAAATAVAVQVTRAGWARSLF